MHSFSSQGLTIDGRPAMLSLLLGSTVDLPEPPPGEENERHHICRHHNIHCSRYTYTELSNKTNEM